MSTPRVPPSAVTSSAHELWTWLLDNGPSFRVLSSVIRRLADTTSPVLLTGEHGVGKEYLARAIHQLGANRQGPFIAVHAADLHDRTPIESAKGGTLYVEGVAHLSPSSQEVLAHFVCGDPASETSPRALPTGTVRVIAATTVELAPAVRNGSFRADLYGQLTSATASVPPIRDHHDAVRTVIAHVLESVNHELARTTTITPEAMTRLVEYPWPGNLRELDAVIRELAAHATGPTIHDTDLPVELRAATRTGTLVSDVRRGAISLTAAVDAFERELIVDALDHTAHVQVQAAKRLGITRRILKYKMDLLGIPVKRPRIRTNRKAA